MCGAVSSTRAVSTRAWSTWGAIEQSSQPELSWRPGRPGLLHQEGEDGVRDPDRQVDGQGVAVGMSGGVDSAVAAMLLRDQGHRVVGITLRLWSDPEVTDPRACCSPETAERAKSVAHSLGIPHIVVDAVEPFREHVVDYFVSEYARGRTPNPCAKCNSRLRFGLLVHLARRLGLAWVSTGHYARLTGESRSLARGIDPRKDQSYVLAEVSPSILEKCIFPLGGMTKDEVRALAAKADIAGRVSAESQEICFIPNDDYRAFLKARLGERPGAIVDRSGRAVGEHSGTYNFTVGQRKGLGVAARDPVRVIAIDAGRAEVVVGVEIAGAIGSVGLADVTVHRKDIAGGTSAQLRSQGGATPAHMIDAHSLVLDEPVAGVALGQTAVLYHGDEVVLAGTIISTTPWADDGRSSS